MTDRGRRSRARAGLRGLGALLLVLLLAPTAVVVGSGGGELVVENRSSSAAEVATWRYQGGHWDWAPVATVPAGYKVPISEVRQDDRFRAFLRERGEYRYHTVDLRRGQGRDRWAIE
jgi:hypothetical protein